MFRFLTQAANVLFFIHFKKRAPLFVYAVKARIDLSACNVSRRCRLEFFFPSLKFRTEHNTKQSLNKLILRA